MLNFKNLALLFQIITTLIYCTIDVIDPSYYIWLDYSKQVPINAKSAEKCTVTIPCVSRIGKCSCYFTLLPPNWSSTSAGQLVIPNSDATKSGTFAVQGQCTEPTGQRIDANLVVKIENWYLSIDDSLDFYKKNNYDFSKSQNKPTQYQTSSLIKPVPDGFPTIQQLQKRLNTQDIENITPVIKGILSKYAPCRSKVNYLTSIKQLLNKLLKSNNDSLVTRQNNINTLEKNLSVSQNGREAALIRLGVHSQLQDINQKIQKNKNQILQLNLDSIQIKRYMKKYQKQMSTYLINLANLENDNTVNLKKLIDDQDKNLQNLFTANLNLNRSILQLNLQKNIKELQSKQMQKVFAKNLQLYVQSQTDLYKIDKIINSLKFEKLQTTQFISAIDKKIKQLKQKSKPTYDKETLNKKINQLSTNNQQINKNKDYVQIMKRYLNMSCNNV